MLTQNQPRRSVKVLSVFLLIPLLLAVAFTAVAQRVMAQGNPGDNFCSKKIFNPTPPCSKSNGCGKDSDGKKVNTCNEWISANKYGDCSTPGEAGSNCRYQRGASPCGTGGYCWNPDNTGCVARDGQWIIQYYMVQQPNDPFCTVSPP